MWELYSQMVLSNTPEEIIATAEQIQIILLRADSIWNGIQASANLKASNLGIQKSKHFVYGGQMKILSHEVKKYVNFYEHPSMFIDKYNRYNEEFALFINNTDDGKMQFLKDKLETIVTNVDSTWGELASKIGMSLPLKIAEEKELFFRRGGRSSN